MLTKVLIAEDEARITALVDVYDASRSKRPYKSEFDQEKTLSIMLEGDGRTTLRISTRST
jgi:HD-GYP domain-containing protein (c-di-GMP phosphodiesterase class II)